MSLVSLWFREGGVMMWPILGAAVLVLGAAFDEGRKVRRGAPEAESGVVLAWGALGAVFGLLGTLTGLAEGARSIAQAGGAEPALIWGGVSVSLITSIFGLCVFGLSLLVWFGLRALKAGARPGA